MRLLALVLVLTACGGSEAKPLTADDAHAALRTLASVCQVFPPDAPRELLAVCAALRAAAYPEIRPSPPPGPPTPMGGSMPVSAPGGSGGSS